MSPVEKELDGGPSLSWDAQGYGTAGCCVMSDHRLEPVSSSCQQPGAAGLLGALHGSGQWSRKCYLLTTWFHCQSWCPLLTPLDDTVGNNEVRCVLK